MEIKVVNKDKSNLSFTVDGIDSVFANTIRRISLVEVPTMAVDEVEFLKNSGALYDEIIAHRLGLVPLVSDIDSYNVKEDCKCKGKGCASCQTTLSLDVKGPCTVYASDLKSKDPAIKAAFPKMPITILLKDQALKLIATAKLGNGKKHTKFSPCHIHYRLHPEVKVENSKNADAVEKICPTHVFSKDGGKLKVKNEMDCILCNACVDIAEPSGSVKVEGNKNKFIFFMESFGQLDNKRVMQEALKIFDSKLDDFSKSIKKVK
ncbi:DNA-directed RNA polymerase subunit D [archaeon]|nr:DNA-directed RNA polymerase subunit D [archaeon]|tara:strand:- start:234 stop:1022 length:789 start_codon:yes stop_codon:yes gene_type:complete